MKFAGICISDFAKTYDADMCTGFRRPESVCICVCDGLLSIVSSLILSLYPLSNTRENENYGTPKRAKVLHIFDSKEISFVEKILRKIAWKLS